MKDDKKPLYWMILFGVVRAVVAWLGGFLEGHGLIDSDTHQRLMSEGVTRVVSWLLLLAPIGWSILQKTQVWGWVKTALLLSPATPSTQVIAAAPGPDKPI